MGSVITKPWSPEDRCCCCVSMPFGLPAIAALGVPWAAGHFVLCATDFIDVITYNWVLKLLVTCANGALGGLVVAAHAVLLVAGLIERNVLFALYGWVMLLVWILEMCLMLMVALGVVLTFVESRLKLPLYEILFGAALIAIIIVMTTVSCYLADIVARYRKMLDES